MLEGLAGRVLNNKLVEVLTGENIDRILSDAAVALDKLRGNPELLDTLAQRVREYLRVKDA